MSNLNVVGNDFQLNGEPIQLISGAIHYFRIHPDQWEDRLKKMKACGLNAIETYMPWNMHEPTPGTFNFEGFYDVEKFIRLANDIGLYVLLRPGPYICAEFEGGGLPWWLNTMPKMALRCNNPQYLERCGIFLNEVITRIKPLLIENGGPIIAIQVENEYGSYGNDKEYLKQIKSIFEKRDVNTLFFTSDGPQDVMLAGGTLPDVLKTVNFGSDPELRFQKLKEYQPVGPLMCMEYWNGWFDHWGDKHLANNRPVQDIADELDWMLKNGCSVNFYMFHGGTNFGFTNGANFVDGKIQPTITSYDYGAPLSESGDMTEKYFAYKEVISKHVEIDNSIKVENSKKTAYGQVELDQAVSLFDIVSSKEWTKSATPLPMEELGQGYGFILYRTTLKKEYTDWRELFIDGLHDRAHIFVDGEFKGVLGGHNSSSEGIDLGVSEVDRQLDILVENLGRVNYSNKTLDMKGILEGVRISGYQLHFGWEILPVPLDDIENLVFSEKGNLVGAPIFYQGTFTVDETADTFLDMSGWTKGVAFINGFNLGRYWEIGPQKTLYIPGPLLKNGENEIVIFDLSGKDNPVVTLTDTPQLG